MKRRKHASTSSADAAILQEKIRVRGDYEHIHVNAKAGHLHIEVEEFSGERWVVARATPLGGKNYGLSFRTHTGRWEPMPIQGSVAEIAKGVVDILAPYLVRYSD